MVLKVDYTLLDKGLGSNFLYNHLRCNYSNLSDNHVYGYDCVHDYNRNHTHIHTHIVHMDDIEVCVH